MEQFQYQIDAIAWMKTREADPDCSGGFLCYEMGLGKTYMMATVIKSNPGRTLILTPKSTILGWLDTLRMVSAFAFDVREFTGKDTYLDVNRPTVIVATHQSIVKNLHWFATQQFNRFVIDEAHVIRNGKTKLSMNCVLLASTIPTRWGITATPFNNSDQDIVTYMRFLHPSAVPAPPVERFKELMIRKTRAEVFPNGSKLIVHKHIYDFEFPEEKQMYEYVSQRIDELDNYIQANRGRLPRHAIGELKLLIMLRQRQSLIHPQIVLNAEKRWRKFYEENDETMTWDHSRVTKVKNIIELIKKDQKGDKNTLVITHFQDEITLISEQLKANGIHHKILNGKTSQKDRRGIEKYIGETNENMYGRLIDNATMTKLGKTLPAGAIRNIFGFISQPTVVLMQIQAGGVGISMPWVHHVINTSPDWNPFMEQQAIYRAYRLTTKHDVHVTQIYLQSTIDGTIHNLQKNKLERSLYWTDDSADTIKQYLAKNLTGDVEPEEDE